MKRTLACLVLTFASAAFAADGDAPQGLSYKGVNIQFGGFLASEIAYRNNNTGSDIGTSFQKIPFTNAVGYGMPEFRGTERQSRFSLLATGEGDGMKFAGYYELDFLGTTPTSNANESNSYAPRTRHVYLQMDSESGWHFLTGQTWSLATLNNKGITPRSEYIPLTIDSQYAAGFDWARQWQLRMTKDWDKTYWFALSLENAQTVGSSGTTIAGVAAAGTGNTYQNAAGSAMSANMSFNGYPDVIAKFAAETGFGHYEVYGLARNFQSRYGAAAVGTQTQKQDTWTESVGVGAIIPIIPQTFDLALSGLFGKGIGRYGTSQLPDATFASDGSLEALQSMHYLAQLTWHASSELDVYATYGQESVKSTTGTTSAIFGYGDKVAADQSGCNVLGGTCAPHVKSVDQINAGMWWVVHKGSYGMAKFGAQYSLTSLKTFEDVNGLAPDTKENMVFASLRYYPF